MAPSVGGNEDNEHRMNDDSQNADRQIDIVQNEDDSIKEIDARVGGVEAQRCS